MATAAVDRLVEFALGISLERLPPSVIAAGKRVLVDTIGCILFGMTEAPSRALAMEMTDASAGPCSTILGAGLRADAMWAAMANGTAGVWHDLDGGHRFLGGHPGVHTIPAVLAVAERRHASGRQLLEAMIAGFEVGACVGRGTTLRPGMHPHGSWPIVGAAAGVGLAMSFDHATLRETINVSSTLTLATSFRAAYDGASVRNLYAGFGAAAGVLAADLVTSGFTGERDGLSSMFGTIAGVHFDAERVVESLGQRWEITRGYHKRHACARYLHSAMDALGAISTTEAILPDDIDRIEVRTFALAASMKTPAPANALMAKFSLPYALAAQLVFRDTGPTAFGDDAVRDPAVRALTERVVVSEDPEMSRCVPAARPAEVVVRLRSGRSLSAAVRLPRDEHDHMPMADAELDAKFMRLATTALGRDAALMLLGRLREVEKVQTVDEITALAR